MKNVPLDYPSFRSFDDGTTAEESTIFNLGEDGALYFYYGGIKIFILIKEKILDVSRVYLQAFDRLDCFTPSNVRESRRVFARTTILAKFEMPPPQHFADIGEFGSTGPRNFASYNYKEGSQLAGKMKNAGEEMAANSRLMAAPWRAHGQTSGP